LLIDIASRQLDALHWSRFQEIDTRFHDPSGRLLFVGDSAHAMAPALGQGATQAIEDGCALVALFAAMHGRSDFSVSALTAAYDRLRRDRIDFVKQMSWHASTALLAGSDPIAFHRGYATSAHRTRLRRLYVDLGLDAIA
jgi:salicylate hydroxylase